MCVCVCVCVERVDIRLAPDMTNHMLYNYLIMSVLVFSWFPWLLISTDAISIICSVVVH